ncbi:MAG: pseudouridine synthase [Verrucomicrobiota bacterium]
MAEKEQKIGFAPPLLGDKPVRLGVLAHEPGQWLALDKPAGMLVEAHRWHPDLPPLMPALQAQAEAGKRELSPYGLREVGAIYRMEPELSGVLLLAATEGARTQLREAYGSGQLELRFTFLAKTDGGPPERVCELPVAVHRIQSRALVSHDSGKKARTLFTRLEQVGNYTWWEARVSYLRVHQVRLHAAEVGLPIVGDRRYRGERPILLSRIKKTYRSRGEERPLYAGICLHLEELSWDGITVNSPLPKGMRVLKERLRD